MAEHTKLPWQVRGLIGVYAERRHVAFAGRISNEGLFLPNLDGADRANAELIVRAVNSHADLLAASKALLNGLDETWEQMAGARIVFNAKAVIKRAEGATD